MKTWLLIVGLLLAGCSTANQDGGTPVTAAPPPTASDVEAAQRAALAAASAAESKTDEVDFTCGSDAECVVKDVGNCCGYYPACVNIDSPTFPDKVKADCAAEGRSAICGFPEISGCQCIEGRCIDVTGPAVTPAAESQP